MPKEILKQEEITIKVGPTEQKKILADYERKGWRVASILRGQFDFEKVTVILQRMIHDSDRCFCDACKENGKRATLHTEAPRVKVFPPRNKEVKSSDVTMQKEFERRYGDN